MEVYDMNEQGVVMPHEPVPALEQYPYDDGDGVERIRYYSKDGENGKLICAENGAIYDVEVIELSPCKLHYFELEEDDDDLQHEVEENQGTD